MKLVIILVLLLVLLGGGGAAAWFLYFQPMQEASAPVEEPPPPPNAVEPLGSLRVPVIQNGAVVRYLQFDMSAELTKPGVEAAPQRNTLNQYKPRLMDAMLRDMIAYFEYQPRTGPVPLTALEDRLTALVNRHLDQPFVARVVIDQASEARQ